MTVNTMMNKLAKVATGKKRTNDFVPIKGAANHGKISTLKEMISFLLYLRMNCLLKLYFRKYYYLKLKGYVICTTILGKDNLDDHDIRIFLYFYAVLLLHFIMVNRDKEKKQRECSLCFFCLYANLYILRFHFV